jgi:hypothetical protein
VRFDGIAHGTSAVVERINSSWRIAQLKVAKAFAAGSSQRRPGAWLETKRHGDFPRAFLK